METDNNKQNTKYEPDKIEKKWQKVWEEKEIYKFNMGREQSAERKGKENLSKYYVLVEWPYPSGDLHIGHWFSFATADVHARVARMLGKNVFFTNGFDAFGLPAENAAIKRGVHPKDWTIKNMETMRKQFETMGTMIDWSHTTAACFPEYYKWNQWIFTRMFEKGLAYKGKMLTNWCPKDQTVLANENIENGKCWRCGSEVIQKEIEQWFIKLTAYADKLLWSNPTQSSVLGYQLSDKGQSVVGQSVTGKLKTDNRTVDWPVFVKVAQNQWIGKKEGVKIRHKVVGMDVEFESFSAYPAWSWADRYIVISPEHPLVEKLVKGTEREKEVRDFVSQMAKQTELERQETTEKLGVFTGRYAKDPFGGPDMPIWLANFALLNFGTGIIRCSGHDERDIEFANKYGITVAETVDKRENGKNATPHDGMGGVLKDSGPFTGRDVGEVVPEVIDWIEKEGIGKRFVNYHIHDWSISRQRYWGTPVPFIYCKNCFSNLKSQSTFGHPREGEDQSKKDSRLRDVPEIGTSLRGNDMAVYGRDYIEINGEKYAMIPVPDEKLPVELPYNVDFTPKGEPPLASNKEWMKVTCPKCGKEAQRDPETLDTFFDSSWYFFRYIDPHFNKEPFDKLMAERLLPVDIYFGGAEHTLGHTLYARFFTQFFHELGLVDFTEFAKKRVQHGVILGTDGNRMSKSKGNVVNPDDVVKEYGADAVRLYLCFMMPYEATAPWNPGGMWGVYRFLKRVWEIGSRFMVHGSQVSRENQDKTTVNNERTNDELSPEDLYQMHTTIKKVGEDVMATKFNTAVSTLMKWLNHLEGKGEVAREEYETLLKLLAPFAPHMTEEIWQVAYGSKESGFQSIHQQEWPIFDEKYLVSDTTTVVVQVNGKVRDNIQVQSSKSKVQSEIEEMARESEKIQRYLEGKEVKKVIYVPGKILNFVIG